MKRLGLSLLAVMALLVGGGFASVAASEQHPAPVTGLSAKKQLEELKVISPQAYQTEVNQTDYAAHTINVAQFLEQAKQPDTVILDLRDMTAYQQAHIQGAKHLGADIEAKKLAALVPNKATNILIYCTNSLFLSRMMSLTSVALPQFIALGYKNTYLLDDAARDTNHRVDRTKQLPMVTEDSQHLIKQ